MISEKLIELSKQWRKLKNDQKDLDFRKATWAREARACFPNEERFLLWLQSDLGETPEAARKISAMATAAEIVPDQRTWSRLGGAGQILAVRVLPKREQVAVLEAAKASGRAVRTIAKERNPEAFRPISSPSTPKIDRFEQSVAEYLAANAHLLPEPPAEIAVVVRMYKPQVRFRAPNRKVASRDVAHA